MKNMDSVLCDATVAEHDSRCSTISSKIAVSSSSLSLSNAAQTLWSKTGNQKTTDERVAERVPQKQHLHHECLQHPIFVVQKQHAQELMDTSTVVSGFNQTRSSLTFWKTSYSLVYHIGCRTKYNMAWWGSHNDRVQIDLKALHGVDAVTILCPVQNLIDGPNILLIQQDGREISFKSDYALLLIIATVKQEGNGGSTSIVELCHNGSTKW